MPDVLNAMDAVSGLLIAAIFAMIFIGPKELKAAKIMLWWSAAIFVGRWILWGFSTEYSWLIRALAGAIIGSVAFALFPALLGWIRAKENEISHSTHNDMAH